MGTILSIKDLSFSYDATEVLSAISLTIDKGDYIALAGPNGAGKTTLVRVILGLEEKYKGTIEIFGKDLEGFSEWRRIGYLPQDVNVFNPLFPATVKEVVGLGLLSHKSFPRKFTRSDEEKILKALELMDISLLKDKLVGALSGGQQQRVFLSRALVSDPELLILDEPSTALDPKTREQFFSLIEKLNKDKGVTLIIITHDTAHIGQYASKLLYLDKKIVFYGGFADFCQSKEMEKFFGPFSQHLICHQHR
ncbi:MAG: ABC transporter ATP-binding protein [Deltaproteobacteria bacterium RBG_16_54_18]|nr:MAG: ABC transporter ATP-binding protein [Deltaproteobacteria bacterium RBG_16_54_18]